jgi:hypothetical protein
MKTGPGMDSDTSYTLNENWAWYGFEPDYLEKKSDCKARSFE